MITPVTEMFSVIFCIVKLNYTVYAIVQQLASWRKMMLGSESSVLSSLGNLHKSIIELFVGRREADW